MPSYRVILDVPFQLVVFVSAQLAGEDFLAGLDRQRADAAGQQLTPVPG